MLEIHSKKLSYTLLIESTDLPILSQKCESLLNPNASNRPQVKLVFTSPWILVDDSEASQGVIYVRQTYDGYIIFKEFGTNSEKE